MVSDADRARRRFMITEETICDLDIILNPCTHTSRRESGQSAESAGRSKAEAVTAKVSLESSRQSRRHQVRVGHGGLNVFFARPGYCRACRPLWLSIFCANAASASLVCLGVTVELAGIPTPPGERRRQIHSLMRGKEANKASTMAGGGTKHVIQNQFALRGLALFSVLLVLWMSAIYTTRSRNFSGWSLADDSCPCLRKQPQYSHFNSINSTKDLFSDQNIARRSHLSGGDSPLEEEITRSEGEIGSMPIHMIQMGHPRTATTLQHAIICAALFLKLHDDPKRKHEPLLKDMVCNRFAPPFLRFEACRPDVLKTHRFGDADLEKQITEPNKSSTWLFATAKTQQQAQTWKTRLQSSGYQIKYVQDLETVWRR